MPIKPPQNNPSPNSGNVIDLRQEKVRNQNAGTINEPAPSRYRHNIFTGKYYSPEGDIITREEAESSKKFIDIDFSDKDVEKYYGRKVAKEYRESMSSHKSQSGEGSDSPQKEKNEPKPESKNIESLNQQTQENQQIVSQTEEQVEQKEGGSQELEQEEQPNYPELYNQGPEEQEQFEEAQQISEEVDEIIAEVEQLRKEGLKLKKKPSKIKYGLLFLLAIIIDVADIAEVTGVGIVVSKPIAFFLGLVIIFIFFITGGRKDSADKYRERAQAFVKTLSQRAANADKALARLLNKLTKNSRWNRIIFNKRTKLGRWARGKKALVFKKLRNIKKLQNPATKSIWAWLVNLVPILAWIPWQTAGIYLSYKDELSALEEAQELLMESVSEGQSSVNQMEENIEAIEEIKKAA